MINLCLGFAVLMAITYIYVELKRSPLRAFMSKALASLSFVMLGVFAASDHLNMSIAPYVIIGLVLGLIGDLVLALRPLRNSSEDKTLIVYGICFFGLGHIFYLLGLSELGAISMISILIGLLMMILIIFMSYILKFEMGKAKIPSYLYAFLIFMMIGQSIIFMMNGQTETFYILFTLGAILFGLSDLILAPIYYKQNKTKIMIALNLITYYGAQILIAYSLFYL